MIFVHRGLYDENVTIDDGMTLLGAGECILNYSAAKGCSRLGVMDSFFLFCFGEIQHDNYK